MSSTITVKSKDAFGRFVQAKRHHVGLTQKELAERLFVTESAVSKWERGLSYPDISMVAALAKSLNVSEGELINASDDLPAQTLKSQAQTYRRWRGITKWVTIAVYVMTILITLIVNISTEHKLTWSWVALLAVVTAFSLTTLPLFITRHRGWITLGASLCSLVSLLGVTQLLYGGTFFLTTVASILFVIVLLFLPIALHQAPIPDSLRRHRTVLIVGIDSLALLLFLFLLITSHGSLHDYVSLALPIVAMCLIFVWAVTLVIRYFHIAGLYRAAIVTALVGASQWIFGIAVDALVTDTSMQFDTVDFSRWIDPYISRNISMIVLFTCLAASVTLCLLQIIRKTPPHR